MSIWRNKVIPELSLLPLLLRSTVRKSCFPTLEVSKNAGDISAFVNRLY